ncbi:Response regulator receiver domain-containing protein [Rhodovulum sp. ES.010]|uniref:response regulator n=1 Tax=Rhodovulum sp. ES.010 TaxID=1882821 RepID=UPI0009297187|nr:response regulator [Rhodovulum sp. ES.010]SIO57004.1 Response regulator receiver domain-containing protein [Rhodovulum sp. ES.010]
MADCSFPANSLEQQTCLAAEAMRTAAAAMESQSGQGASAEGLARLLEALGAVLLPAAVLVLVWRLWPYLVAVLKSRGFTVRMGGAELSVQNATTQFEKQLKDSADKIVRLERQVSQVLEGRAAPKAQSAREAERTTPAGRARPAGVLWVDDHPENNSFLVAALRDRGIRVETARSTEEAMQLLGTGPDAFGVVISDLGRTEAGVSRPMAGRDLAQQLRSAEIDVPMLVFASVRALRRREELQAAGVKAVTTSGTDLLRFVEEHIAVAG